MSVERKPFGLLASGEECSLFILKSDDITVTLSDYGATLVSILLPDGRGGCDDVLLGASTLSGYAAKHPFFGVTVGRYANRIAGGRFSLGGKAYSLAVNDGQNHLHGGLKGFNAFVWKAEASEGKLGCGREIHENQPRRRGRLSRPIDRRREFHARKRRGALHFLYGAHRRRNRGQPHEPCLFQSKGRGERHDTRSRALPGMLIVPSCRFRTHPDGGARRRRRRTLRFQEGQAHRQGHRGGGRLRPLLRHR